MTRDTDVQVPSTRLANEPPTCARPAADRAHRRFVHRDGLHVYEMDDEAVVYDPAHHAIHYLNPTALAIWQRCDGRHSLAEMARALHAAFDSDDAFGDLDRLRDDVRGTVEALADNGLVDEAGTDAP